MKRLLTELHKDLLLNSIVIAKSGLGSVVGLAVREADELREAFDDAIALLRDWEDYDPDDPECEWDKRRDEFLAEHEGAGR